MRPEIAPEIVRAAQAGAPADMEVLLAQLWPHAYRVAFSVAQDRVLAEDAAQEASAIIYREIGNLRSPDAFRVWMYRIVIREALRLVKRDATAPNVSQPQDEPDIESRLDVLRALARLPAQLRAVVVLRYYADLNSREIATVLGIPSATVRFRLGQARQRLSHLLRIEHRPRSHAPEACP